MVVFLRPLGLGGQQVCLLEVYWERGRGELVGAVDEVFSSAGAPPAETGNANNGEKSDMGKGEGN